MSVLQHSSTETPPEIFFCHLYKKQVLMNGDIQTSYLTILYDAILLVFG